MGGEVEQSMFKISVGVDCISIDRVKQVVDNNNEHYVCSNDEYTKKSYETFAGLFAAKEAISKALGTGLGKECSFKDISILKDGKGKPEVVLSKEVRKVLGVNTVEVSISHTDSIAIAVAIVSSLRYT